MATAQRTSGLAAVLVALLVAGLLGRATIAQAQPPPPTEPWYFPETGYRITEPAFADFFARRGGLAAFGYPVSATLRLLGRPTQLFQRQVLQLAPDGSVQPLNLLGPDLLPLTRLHGSTFPPEDPTLTAGLPAPSEPDYLAQVLTYVAATAPDEWQGQPVRFGSTFRQTVSCATAFPDRPCPPDLLPALALEIWGLPTSRPAPDPRNPSFVYQRFQRGILQYDATRDVTEGLLLGDWFKRVLLGTDLPPDLQAEVAGSRFLAQVDPTGARGLARPAALPDTDLSGGFTPDDLARARPIREVVAVPTAAPQPPTVAPGPPTSPTGTPVPVVNAPPTATPPASVEGCLGDEQMFFVPRKPFVGTDAIVAVTSSRHHNSQWARLTGPVNTGPVVERQGLSGWVWEWTIPIGTAGWYEFTFYADGARPCITSGFNAEPVFGATPTPTATGEPTQTATPTTTPTSTPTATSTSVPAPVLASFDPPGGQTDSARTRREGATCSGDQVTISGDHFGASQGSGAVLIGGRSADVTVWTQKAITFVVPAGLTPGAEYVVRVVTADSEGRSTYRLSSLIKECSLTPTAAS